jgi:hypothetical protein
MPFEPRLLPIDDDGRDPPAERIGSVADSVSPKGDWVSPVGDWVSPVGDSVSPVANSARFEDDTFESPDLELLAGQLRDDAAYLARLYPPGAARSRPAVNRWSWGRSHRRLASAAAVLFLIGMGGSIAAWSAGGRTLVDRGTVHRSQNDFVNSEAFDTSAESNQSATGGTTNHVTSEIDESGLEPSALLRELSVSEQEAVFDLLEDQPIELARISL